MYQNTATIGKVKREQELEDQEEQSMADDIKKPLSAWLEYHLEATANITGILRNLAIALIGIALVFKN